MILDFIVDQVPLEKCKPEKRIINNYPLSDMVSKITITKDSNYTVFEKLLDYKINAALIQKI